jgi:hypothetical protein
VSVPTALMGEPVMPSRCDILSGLLHRYWYSLLELSLLGIPGLGFPAFDLPGSFLPHLGPFTCLYSTPPQKT